MLSVLAKVVNIILSDEVFCSTRVIIATVQLMGERNTRRILMTRNANAEEFDKLWNMIQKVSPEKFVGETVFYERYEGDEFVIEKITCL